MSSSTYQSHDERTGECLIWTYAKSLGNVPQVIGTHYAPIDNLEYMEFQYEKKAHKRKQL